ncbi:acyltransferase [Pseudoclavibacter terrae]
MLHRVLRIFPAYWVILLATAFVLSPLAAFIAGETWVPGSAVSYVVGNLALWNFQWGIDETLSQVPLATLWNGSLWTLFFEFSAYIGAAVLLSASKLRKHALLLVSITLAALLVGQILAHGPLEVTTNLYLNSLRLGGFFLAGMWLFLMADRIRVDYLSLAVALALFATMVVTGTADWLGQLPFAFILLWLASRLKVRLGARNDISYGIYIWAFPIQQLIMVCGLSWMGPYGTIVLALCLTSGVAWLSWKYVEQPAMRLRHRVPRRLLGHPLSQRSVLRTSEKG